MAKNPNLVVLGVVKRSNPRKVYDANLLRSAGNAAMSAIKREQLRKIPKDAPGPNLGLRSANWDNLQTFGCNGKTASQFHGSFSQAKKASERKRAEARGEHLKSRIISIMPEFLSKGMSESDAGIAAAEKLHAMLEENLQLGQLAAQSSSKVADRHGHGGRFVGQSKTLNSRSILGRKVGDVVPSEDQKKVG
jgi:hypothetical protein